MSQRPASIAPGTVFVDDHGEVTQLHDRHPAGWRQIHSLV